MTYSETDSIVPPGTTGNSPRFEPWVGKSRTSKLRRGERTLRMAEVISSFPDGTRCLFAPLPSDESLGYFLASLRDLDLVCARMRSSKAEAGSSFESCR